MVNRFFVLLTFCVFLPSCSWLFGDEGYFRDRGHDYLKAKEQPAIPQDELRTYDALAIPVIPERALPDEFSVPEPEPLLADQDRNAVKIQKLGEQQWLLVPLPPEQTWPRVRYFLENNKINIDGQDVNQGLVETAWLTNKDNDLQEKYRIRIEQGVQRNTAEVYLQQIQQTKGLNATVSWPSSGSVNSDRESWMLGLLAQYLANISDKASVSLMAQGISNASRVALAKDENQLPYIILDLEFDRAWASLGNAIKKAEFVIDDINRSQGVFFVHHTVEKDRRPFFLFRWFGASSTEEKHYKLKMLQHDKLVHISLIDAEEIGLSEHEKVLIQIKGFLN